MIIPSANAITILRIEIEDIEPLIWRRVAVRSSTNLKDLHKVIQVAMGWLDYHLWEFTANERKYRIPIPNEAYWNERISDAATTKLSALLGTSLLEIGHLYDIGDNWQHRIIVEGIKPAGAGKSYPQFLSGERRCPPQDCGGPPAIFEFIENIVSKRSKKTRGHLEQ